ncbi:MAG: GtrA family protein, partial [Ruminococcus sp.]|nr:GtrA family protein [Ruminococcus sp.]
ISNIISFILGLIVNYTLSKFWIFKLSKVNSNVIEFLGFTCIGLVGLILTIIVTKLFALLMSDFTNIYQITGKIVSTAMAFFWNFFARKYLLFKK